MTLFLLVYANIYEHIKSVSEISMKKKIHIVPLLCLSVCALVCVCDGLAPSCLRLAPRHSLHTTLFLTRCL